jgi:hypothetical protein
MRVIREINHPQCKITIFAWNNRYLIKIEQGYLEQTYKVNETDVASDADLLEMLDDKFITNALDLFQQMSRNLIDAQSRTGF